MTEKQAFIDTFNREAATSMKVISAYPDAKLDLKPAAQLRTARDLAWAIAGTNTFLGMVIDENVQPGGGPPAPASVSEIIAGFKSMQAESLKKIEALPDAAFGSMMKFHVGPGTIADLPKGAVMWTVLYDQIHHRGQFSVYLRAAGAKVPSIYGPTADEPWM